MRLKSVAVAVAAALAAALGVIVPAPAAAAAGQCSVIAPTKIVIDRDFQEVPFRLADNCAAADTQSAWWYIVHPSEGVNDWVWFTDSTTETWDVYDWLVGPARYTVRPDSAEDGNFDPVSQNTAYVTVKLGSRLTATTSRSNGVLRFNAYARTYSPKLSDWYKRSGAKVSLMYQAPASSTWTWVKAAYTDSAGRVSLSVAPKYGSYRLLIKETGTVWASYSTVVRGK